ncbi:MAG TPA: hypothetical protein VGZ69_01580 [Candidatus Rhabdochlamydia sp.]|jgi:hypothetical protein|nr:hypothetical protein [Candidatus Rhabdochlamydia sp.]
MKDHLLNTSNEKKILVYKSNEETLAAIKELEEGHGTRCTSIDDFWRQMEIDPEI